jgi:hypothetical protein
MSGLFKPTIKDDSELMSVLNGTLVATWPQPDW